VYYRLSIAKKLLRSDFWTTGDRKIALLLAGPISLMMFSVAETNFVKTLFSKVPQQLKTLPVKQG